MEDPAVQRSILKDALQAGRAMTEPSLVTLSYRWIDDHWKQDPLSWTRQRQDALHLPLADADGSGGTSAGDDTRTPRSDQPIYQFDSDREAALASPFEQQCLVCIGLPNPIHD